MYGLDFLRTVFSNACTECPLVDFRLACSGELYAGRVLTSDWRKSDVTRVLLRDPFELLVASMPFDAYPQELCLRMPALMAEEHEKNVHVTLQTDEFVCADLADLFTVVFRRLVRKAGKVGEEHRGDWARKFPSPMNKRPMPSFASKIVAWRQRPATLLYGVDGIEAKTHEPPPVAVDEAALRAVLQGIAEAAPPLEAEAFLRAARLYGLALELIEERPALAYQLLVATVETAAAVVLEDWQPDHESMRMSLGWVAKWARDHHLSETDASSLLEAASARERWVRRKFVRFLVDYAEHPFCEPDPVFPFLPESLIPTAGSDFEQTMRTVYDARSKATHSGEVFSGYACAGATYRLPHDAFGFDPGPVPPVVWFERVVNSALNRWLMKLAGTRNRVCLTPAENDVQLGESAALQVTVGRNEAADRDDPGPDRGPGPARD